MQEHLAQRVRAVAAEFAERAHGPARAELEAIAQRLDEPLRVAVVGRIKAGKSTLVNALLGQRVAPTDVSECTRVVTWFRYGLPPARVEVRLRDGGTEEIELAEDGTLPAHLGVDPAGVESLQVWPPNESLQRMIVIDTPGLGSLDESASASTGELINVDRSSRAAANAADAIALVLNQTVRADEQDVLEDWKAAGGQPADETNGGAPAPDGPAPLGSAANAIAVLSKADKI